MAWQLQLVSQMAAGMVTHRMPQGNSGKTQRNGAPAEHRAIRALVGGWGGLAQGLGI